MQITRHSKLSAVLFKAVLGLVGILSYQAASAQASPEDFAGKWHNTFNTEEINLTVDAAGKVTGTLSAMGGKAKPLVGFASGNAISFVVNFSDVGTVTAWTGHLVGGQITTLWQMSFEAKTADVWKSTLAGADNFIKGAGDAH